MLQLYRGYFVRVRHNTELTLSICVSEATPTLHQARVKGLKEANRFINLHHVL